MNPLNLPSISLSAKTQLPLCSGIYFVMDGGKVIYIGKAADLKSRWMTHHRYKQISSMCTYPRLSWIEIGDPSLLPEIEAALICRFEPVLNNRKIPKSLCREVDKGRIAFYVDPEVKAKLEKLAEKDLRSLSNLVEKLLLKAVAEAEKSGEI